jgi:hypothetical protein
MSASGDLGRDEISGSSARNEDDESVLSSHTVTSGGD